MKTGLIYTNDNCKGCNRCIAVCPILQVNYSRVSQLGKNIIDVDADSCIHCGSCITACTHKAREYDDDTAAFLNDLKSGKKLSLLVAPAFVTNYPNEYKKIFGYLKKLGVQHIISVSFGADITTWAYLNYITKNNFVGGISQPCPAVVDYIEKYVPELVDKLVPVHSPMMCAAIYAKKYMGITDDLAFLSPCIAKKSEISRPENAQYVKYNVTFDHLMKALKKTDLSGCEAVDELEYGLGSIYPMPGGLKSNVEYFLGNNIMIRQAEGPQHIYKFLQNYSERLKNGKTPPFMVDALNCQSGCIFGTAIERDRIDNEDTVFEAHRQKLAAAKKKLSSPWNQKQSFKSRLKKLNRSFSKLKLDDFICKYYKNRVVALPEPGKAQMEEIFRRLNKYTEDDRSINCGACGYEGGCRDMAKAIAHGINRPENCIYYIKSQLEREKGEIMTMSQRAEQEHIMVSEAFESAFNGIGDINSAMSELNLGNQSTAAQLEELTIELQQLVEESNKISEAVSAVEEAARGYEEINKEVISVSEQTGLLAINAGIEAARAGISGKGFSVIAQQIKQLANQIETTAGNGTMHGERIAPALRQLESVTRSVAESTGKIGDKVSNMASASREISAQTATIDETAERIKVQMSSAVKQNN